MPVDLGPLIDAPAEQETTDYVRSDNPDTKAHIINPPDNAEVRAMVQRAGISADPMPQEIVDYARKHGLEVRAICGYRFIPKHDPDKHEACQQCFDIAGVYMRMEG